jgi:hypothetical protein
LKITVFITILTITIYKNFFSNHFFNSVVDRIEPEQEPELEPEPQFIISAPAPGGNLISAYQLLALCFLKQSCCTAAKRWAQKICI